MDGPHFKFLFLELFTFMNTLSRQKPEIIKKEKKMRKTKTQVVTLIAKRLKKNYSIRFLYFFLLLFYLIDALNIFSL